MNGDNRMALELASPDEFAMFMNTLRKHSPSTVTEFARGVPDKAIGEIGEVALKYNLSIRQMQMASLVAVERLKNRKIYENVPNSSNPSGNTIEKENPSSESGN